MGILLSILVASVGAMDVINCLALMTNQLTTTPAKDVDLEQYRRLLKEQIDSAPRSAVEGLTYAQDGVLYKDGYRVEKFDDARLDQLNVKIKDLERKSQDKEQKLERLNAKLQELEQKSVEREMVIQELRSRTVSRAASPVTEALRVPQIVLDEGDSQQGSKKFRPIHRDDEFRRTVKKKSVSSNTSEDRTEELDRLTQLEMEESETMEDYIPLVYLREDQLDPNSMRHKISPIQEHCQMHDEEDRLRSTEHSPELSLGIKIVKPWGDVKQEKEDIKRKILTSRQFSIEEETRDSDSSALEEEESTPASVEETKQWLQSSQNLFPEVPLLTSSESVPSNLSSHSNSPDPDHPTLKRTRKKSDLTALLLEEERKGEAYEEVVIQLEKYDTEGGNRTKFMQSKSASPCVDELLENERQKSPNQLIPAIVQQPKSPTPNQATLPRDAPKGSSGAPDSPVSSITDESAKDSRTRGQPERNVSRDGSVSLASTDASIARLDLHVGKAPHEQSSSTLPPPIRYEEAAVADLDAGGADRRTPREPSAEDKRSTPPKRFRTRKRVARSVTPINFNQTFMDQLTDQRISVSPSELEDYINSMGEIKIDPPKPVTPNYLLPTTPMTSGVPSLMITDDKGSEARFHDSLSARSFYGSSDNAHPSRVFNHNVNYVEWIKKFPENMTSHLELEDYDSDDEEVEHIINNSSLETKIDEPVRTASPMPLEQEKFPVYLPAVVTPTPDPIRDLPISPEVLQEKPAESRTEFPLNLQPSYVTPSPASMVSDLLSESAPDSSSLALGSPLMNSLPSPTSHFTPIISPTLSIKSPTPDSHSLSPRPLPKLIIPSRSPSSSPYPPDMTPEEMVYDIAHLDGLIFEAKSRSTTPSLQTPSLQATPLSPEELAYDIGNLGGLILGPPSRSASPLPPSSSPGSSSLSSPWTSLQPPSSFTETSEDEQNTTTQTHT